MTISIVLATINKPMTVYVGALLDKKNIGVTTTLQCIITCSIHVNTHICTCTYTASVDSVYHKGPFIPCGASENAL